MRTSSYVLVLRLTRVAQTFTPTLSAIESIRVDNQSPTSVLRTTPSYLSLMYTPIQPVPDYYCEKVGTLSQYRQWSACSSSPSRVAMLIMSYLQAPGSGSISQKVSLRGGGG